MLTCDKIATYNTATAEQTDADREIYRDQAAYVGAFDSMVKEDEKVGRVVILQPEAETLEPEIIEAVAIDAEPDNDFEEAIAEYSGDYWKEKARQDI